MAAIWSFFNQNKETHDWDEYDDLNDPMGQKELHPNIPAEFLRVQLESDYHLHVSAKEEEFVDQNTTSAITATNVGISLAGEHGL